MQNGANQWGIARWFDAALGVLALVMVLVPKLVAIPFLLILIVAVTGLWQRRMQFRFSWIALGFVLLYLIYALYCLWTNHPAEAGKYLEYKLSFILIPVLFAYRPEGIKYNLTMTAFIVAVTSLLAYSCINGLMCMQQGGDIHCFLSSVFSNLHHPTYFSAYLVLATALMWYGYLNKWKLFAFWPVVLLTLFFAIGIILCLSLAGLLFLFGLVAILVLYGIYRKWGRWVALLGLIVAPLAVWFTIVSIPYVEGEWTAAKYYADQYRADPANFVRNRPQEMSGSEARIVMWTAAWAEFKDHPMGVGTANMDDHLEDRLIEWGQPTLAALHYNPHNQYFQTAIETGIPGLAVLVGLVIYAIGYGLRRRNWLLVLIAANMGFNCLFESMLQRQSGIVFYVFWMVLLVGLTNHRKTDVQ